MRGSFVDGDGKVLKSGTFKDSEGAGHFIDSIPPKAMHNPKEGKYAKWVGVWVTDEAKEAEVEALRMLKPIVRAKAALERYAKNGDPDLVEVLRALL